MSNVIGPIDSTGWTVLLSLRKSINWYKNNYDPKYSRVLDKTNKIYSKRLESLKAA